MPAAELQIAMEKLKEESSFSISKLEEQLSSATELLDDKENQLNTIRNELESSKRSLSEQISKSSSKQENQSIQIQVRKYKIICYTNSNNLRLDTWEESIWSSIRNWKIKTKWSSKSIRGRK